MNGFEVLYVLVVLFAARILLPAAIVLGIGSLAKKIQPSL